MATENPCVDTMSETKETTMMTGHGANNTNITIATKEPYFDAMPELTETKITAGSGSNYTM